MSYREVDLVTRMRDVVEEWPGEHGEGRDGDLRRLWIVAYGECDGNRDLMWEFVANRLLDELVGRPVGPVMPCW